MLNNKYKVNSEGREDALGYKLLELKTSKLIDSLFVGNYKTKYKGKGIEFADYKEYEYQDDIKNIDFVKSDKEGKVLVKLYEEERELSVYFVIDLNSSFIEKNKSNKTKEDLLLEILYLIGLSAIKSGDKVGSLFSFGDKKKIFISKKGKQNFINIINNLHLSLSSFKGKSEEGKIRNIWIDLLNIFKKTKKTSQINTIKYFNNLKIKKSLVFYITDNISLESKDLKILATKNDLIFCNIFNSFENDLDGKGVIGINKSEINIDLSDKNKINKYKELRDTQINELKKNIIRFGGKYLFLDEKVNVYKEFYKLFKI